MKKHGGHKTIQYIRQFATTMTTYEGTEAGTDPPKIPPVLHRDGRTEQHIEDIYHTYKHQVHRSKWRGGRHVSRAARGNECMLLMTRKMTNRAHNEVCGNPHSRADAHPTQTPTHRRGGGSSCLVVRGTIRRVDVRVPDALVAVQANAEAHVGDDPVGELFLYLCRQHIQGLSAELAGGHLLIPSDDNVQRQPESGERGRRFFIFPLVDAAGWVRLFLFLRESISDSTPRGSSCPVLGLKNNAVTAG